MLAKMAAQLSIELIDIKVKTVSTYLILYVDNESSYIGPDKQIVLA